MINKYWVVWITEYRVLINDYCTRGVGSGLTSTSFSSYPEPAWGIYQKQFWQSEIWFSREKGPRHSVCLSPVSLVSAGWRARAKDERPTRASDSAILPLPSQRFLSTLVLDRAISKNRLNFNGRPQKRINSLDENKRRLSCNIPYVVPIKRDWVEGLDFCQQPTLFRCRWVKPPMRPSWFYSSQIPANPLSSWLCFALL